MKAFVVTVAFCVLIAAAVAVDNSIENSESSDNFCYSKVDAICRVKPNQKGTSKEIKPVCNSRFGAMSNDESVVHVLQQLQKYVNTHITRSYEYLMMATHYANYQMNRPGFEKLFRDLSDSKWKAALELIEYITKRGGEMDFMQYNEMGAQDTSKDAKGKYETYELQSIAMALDIEKKLTMEANIIHSEAIGKNRSLHDSEMSHYIEEAFTEKQAETIRKLSGYTTDLTGLLNSNDGSLALYLFDEYLTKQ